MLYVRIRLLFFFPNSSKSLSHQQMYNVFFNKKLRIHDMLNIGEYSIMTFRETVI